MKKILILFLLLGLTSCISEEKEKEKTIEIENKNTISSLENDTRIYNFLNEDEKLEYDNLYNKIINFEEIDSINNEISLKSLIMDNPELFYLSYDNNIVSYTMTKQEYEKEFERIQTLANTLKKDSDLDTIITINDYLVHNTRYSYSHSSEDFYNNNLVEGQGNCFGYTNANKLLYDLTGINSISIFGIANQISGSGTHSFNIVELDDKLYIVDTTWNDHTLSNVNENNQLSVSLYNYFLVNLPKTHVPDSIYPEFDTSNFEYYESLYKNSEKNISEISNIIQNSNYRTTSIKMDKKTFITNEDVNKLNELLKDKQVIEYKRIPYDDYLLVIFITT